jgi:hypothetical protein
MAPLLVFIALQLGDALTTLLCLRNGIGEANPLIRFIFGLTSSPALSLFAVKAAGCVPAWLAWRSRRRRLLTRVNYFFAACIAWNLLVVATSM